MCQWKARCVPEQHVWKAVTYLSTLMSSVLFCGRSPRICQTGVIVSLQRRTPTGSHNAPPMRRDFHKLWQKSHLYHKNDTLFFQTLYKVWDVGRESGKYHLLLMLLSTFGASLASTALRHCITIRWLSVGSATDGILLKTDFAFELPDIPDRKVPPLAPNAVLASLCTIALLVDVD